MTVQISTEILLASILYFYIKRLRSIIQSAERRGHVIRFIHAMKIHTVGMWWFTHGGEITIDSDSFSRSTTENNFPIYLFY